MKKPGLTAKSKCRVDDNEERREEGGMRSQEGNRKARDGMKLEGGEE